MTLSSTTIYGKFKADVQGTALYIPSEFLRNPQVYRTHNSLDVWSHGILFFFKCGRPEEMRFHIMEATELSWDGELIRRAEGWVKNISDERQRTLARACLKEECRLRPSMLHVLLLLYGRIDDLFSPINPTALLDYEIRLSLRTTITDEHYDENNSLNTARNQTFRFGSEIDGLEDIEVNFLFEELLFFIDDYELRSTHNRDDATTCSNGNQNTEKQVNVSVSISISVDIALQNKIELQADERRIDGEHRTEILGNFLQGK